jgi:hypothetical protein
LIKIRKFLSLADEPIVIIPHLSTNPFSDISSNSTLVKLVNLTDFLNSISDWWIVLIDLPTQSFHHCHNLNLPLFPQLMSSISRIFPDQFVVDGKDAIVVNQISTIDLLQSHEFVAENCHFEFSPDWLLALPVQLLSSKLLPRTFTRDSF